MQPLTGPEMPSFQFEEFDPLFKEREGAVPAPHGSLLGAAQPNVMATEGCSFRETM